MGKIIDVKSKYSQELEDIDYTLRNLENNRYYEKSGAKMDGYLATNIQNVRKNIADLINKIEYDKESIDDKISEAFSKVNK